MPNMSKAFRVDRHADIVPYARMDNLSLLYQWLDFHAE